MTLQDTTKRPRSVYLVHIVDTDYYKIGIAYDVQGRLRTMQSGSPFVIVLICSFEQEDAEYTEQALHKALRDYHVRGEWFECSPEKVRMIFNAYAAPNLRTSWKKDDDEESIVKQAFLADIQDPTGNRRLSHDDIFDDTEDSRKAIRGIMKVRKRLKLKPYDD